VKLTHDSIHQSMNNSFYMSFTYSPELSSVVDEGHQLIDFIKKFYWKQFCEFMFEKHSIEESRFSLFYSAVVDEVCIYLDSRYYGYFDHELIKQIETDSLEYF